MVKFASLGLMAIAAAAVSAAPAANHPMSLAAYEKQAGGTLPNTPLPDNLKDDAILNLQVIAANELFETQYFTTLLNKVENGDKGFTEFGGLSKSYVIKSLKTIIAQEYLHATGANAILASAGGQTIGACEYKFPPTTFVEAAALAATFTDLVLGTLQEVQKTFAADGGQAASGLVPLIGSIIGQEGEQTGAFRLIQKKTPSSAPFLTAGTGAFAFNAVVQNFVASCPSSSNVSTIEKQIPSLKVLKLSKADAMPAAKDQTIKFVTYDLDASSSANSLTYISGQNAPVNVPIKNVVKRSKYATFEASFPFDSQHFSNGLTIAALTNSNGPFDTAAAVAAATVAGPGLIEVN